jgi:hypothetical protein
VTAKAVGKPPSRKAQASTRTIGPFFPELQVCSASNVDVKPRSGDRVETSHEHQAMAYGGASTDMDTSGEIFRNGPITDLHQRDAGWIVGLGIISIDAKSFTPKQRPGESRSARDSPNPELPRLQGSRRGIAVRRGRWAE